MIVIRSVKKISNAFIRCIIKKFVYVFILIGSCSVAVSEWEWKTKQISEILSSINDIPQGMCGQSILNPYIESLPPESRGVYIVLSEDGKTKYIKNSTDIDDDLYQHIKDGNLLEGDRVFTFIFDHHVCQNVVLDFEKKLIEMLSQKHHILNQSPGMEPYVEQVSKILSSIDIPPEVCGQSILNPYTESLPHESRGVYIVLSEKQMEYIGLSADINRRIKEHIKSGKLIQGQFVLALIFPPNIRQSEVQNFERKLIRTLSPKLNIHNGSPGRGWGFEAKEKVEKFYEYNKDYLTDYGLELVNNVIKGKVVGASDRNTVRRLLHVMRLFR